ncbi:alcohol-forming fatty acyl-CoA reductase [Ranunculus cassubicifolius]
MRETVENYAAKLREMKAYAEETLRDNEKHLEEIIAIKEVRNQRQITYNNLVKLRYAVLKLLKIKRKNAVKQLEESIEKMKTLDDEIAGIGLNQCLKMVQLKIRYEIEVDDVIRTHQEKILVMIGEELRAKEVMNEAKSLQRRNHKLKRRLEELEKKAKKRLEDSREMVKDIEKSNKWILEWVKMKELHEIEALRRKAKWGGVDRCLNIVGSALRFVIFIYVLVLLYRS